MRAFVAACLVMAGIAIGASGDETRAEDLIRRLQPRHDATVWRMFRSSDDNTLRSFLVRDAARLGLAATSLIDRLQHEPDVSARRALILALGGYDPAAIPVVHRVRLERLLRGWVVTDPDAGVHSAIVWISQRRGYATRGRGATGLATSRDWFVTAEGQTLTIFRDRRGLTAHMGSPAGEPGREPASDSAAEPEHAVAIPRAFAIGTTEVTRAQFQRFLDANPEVARTHDYPEAPGRMADVLARFGPDADGPAIAVTWYEAAMYCNWLSARDGLPASEWVYPRGRLADGSELPIDYLQRAGYRLPTEPEWELAARADTRTARFFGSAESLLEDFAWFAKHPPRAKNDPVDPGDPQRTMAVGQLRPNDAGLFDVYGNVWEWTQDRVERYQTSAIATDREDDRLTIRDADARTRRGGAYAYEAAMARSAARGTVTSLPTNRRDNVGFRIAKTVRP